MKIRIPYVYAAIFCRSSSTKRHIQCSVYIAFGHGIIGWTDTLNEMQNPLLNPCLMGRLVSMMWIVPMDYSKINNITTYIQTVGVL